MKRVFFAAMAIGALGATITGCHSGSGSAASGDSTYTLTGTVKGADADSGWAILHYSKAGGAQTDSARISAGRFTFTGSVSNPQFASLELTGAPAGSYPLAFFLESGTTTVTAVPDSL
jgi:hypothetical protein